MPRADTFFWTIIIIRTTAFEKENVVFYSNPYRYKNQTNSNHFLQKQFNLAKLSEPRSRSFGTGQQDAIGINRRVSFPDISLKESLLNHLLRNYKRYERPTEGYNKPTYVFVQIKMLAITSVDVINMQYTADMILLQTWSDSRLCWQKNLEFQSFTDNLLLTAMSDDIWKPDLFFRNGKVGFQFKMTVPNQMIRVSPQGEVIYSQKITMNLACEMNLKNFPMDRQDCHMNIGSYGYTTDQLMFVWLEKKPFVFADDMQISEFSTPEETETRDCTVPDTTSTGTYSCLLGEFQLKRQIGSYLVGTYIPDFLIVIVSWLTFWVNTDAISARVSLGLLTLISLLTKGSSLVSTLPRVSYIRAIDVWLMACLLFVIASMLEFTTANYLARRAAQLRWNADIRESVRDTISRVLCPCQTQNLHELMLRCTCCGVGIHTQPCWTPCCCCFNCDVNDATMPKKLNSEENHPIESHTGVREYYCNYSFCDPARQVRNRYNNRREASKRNKSTSPGSCLIISNQMEPELSKHITRRKSTKLEAKTSYKMSSLRTASSRKNLSVKFIQDSPRHIIKHQEHKRAGSYEPTTQAQSWICQFHPLPERFAKIALMDIAQQPIDIDSEIDAYSRFLFPCFFVLFNCCYWLFYLIISDSGLISP